MTTVDHQDAVVLRQCVLEVPYRPAWIRRVSVVVLKGRRLPVVLEFLDEPGVGSACVHRLGEPVREGRHGRSGVGRHTDGHAGEPAECVRPVVDLDDLLPIRQDLSEVGRPFVQAGADDDHHIALGECFDRQMGTQSAADSQIQRMIRAETGGENRYSDRCAKTLGQSAYLGLRSGVSRPESTENRRLPG